MKSKLKDTKYWWYFVLRFIVVLVGVRQWSLENYDSVFLCVLTLVLFLIPEILNKRFSIVMPSTLEIIVIVFIFAAEILGEVSNYYQIYPYWDTILHTTNGFLMGAIGLALVDILNRSDKIAISLSPTFIGLTAFCFSMTTGVIWEFYEFFMDQVFLSDMQKDTVINTISSVMLHPQGLNVAVPLTINEIIVNGQTWNYGGYIDIGLIDTMDDMIVNFIGALVFSILGVFYIKGRGKFAARFIPKLKKKE